MKNSINSHLHKLLILLSLLCLITAGLLTTARALTPKLHQYQAQIETWTSQQLSQPVHISHIKASWDIFSPVIQFDNVQIFNSSRTHVLLSIERLGLRISVFRSLWRRKIIIDKLLVTGSQMNLKQQPQGGYSVSDIKTITSDPNSSDIQTLIEISNWIFIQPEVYLDNFALEIQTSKGSVIPITGLTMHLHNNGNVHHLTGQGAVSQKHPSSIFFDAYLRGSLQDLNHFQAQTYVRASDILSEQVLTEWTKEFFHINSGILNTDIWATWKKRQWTKIKTQFNIKQLNLTTVNNENFNVTNLDGSLEFKLISPKKWSLKGDKIRFSLNKHQYPTNQFYLLLTKQPGQKLLIEQAQIATLDLQMLYPIKNYLPANLQQALDNFHPTGNLNKLNFNYNTVNKTFNLDATLEKITQQRWHKLPGIKNLSGDLTLTNTQALFKVNSTALELDFGNEFRAPLYLAQLQSTISWLKKPNDDWSIKAEKINAQNQDLKIQGDLLLKIPQLNSGTRINALLKFELFNLKNNSLYLPRTLLSKNLADWLNHAIIDGKSGVGTLTLRGNLIDFPFSNKKGNFLIDSQLNGIHLAYQPKWPALKNLNVRLRFDTNQMWLNATQGNILASKLLFAQAFIPQLDADFPLLAIDGKMSSSLSDGLAFINQSPLHDILGAHLNLLNLSGAMQLALQLKIPLKSKHPIKINGVTEFVNARLEIPKWKVTSPLSPGKLVFTENSLQSNLIKGAVLNKPVQFFLEKKADAAETVITLNGDIDTNVLHISAPLNQQITGQTTYQAKFILNSNKDNLDHFMVTSNLKGIESRLPAPLNKPRVQETVLQTDIQIGNDQQLPVKFSYNEKIFGDLVFKNQADSWLFSKGVISFGSPDIKLSSTSNGLDIQGKITNFSLDNWLSFVDKISLDKKTPSLNMAAVLNKVNLEIDTLVVFKKILASAFIKLQTTNETWDLAIDSQMISGNIQIPKTKNLPYILNLEHLYLTDANKSAFDKPVLANIPALTFKTKDFQYNNKKLHAVSFRLVPVAKDWLKIEDLNITSPSLTINAAGYWQQVKTQNMTKLSGAAASNNLQATLQDLNLPAGITSKKASAQFKLTWPSVPYDPELAILNGKVNLLLKNGKITDIENSSASKIGFGRLLTLLSLQSLQRRLMLDFSDLTTQGYSFDKLLGDFKLRDGNADTSNLTIESAVALINLQGRIDIPAKDINFDITVIPHLTASLPLIATIAGGPIVGAAAWAADKILSSEVQKFTKYYYKMQGPWFKPTITPSHK